MGGQYGVGGYGGGPSMYGQYGVGGYGCGGYGHLPPQALYGHPPPPPPLGYQEEVHSIQAYEF